MLSAGFEPGVLTLRGSCPTTRRRERNKKPRSRRLQGSLSSVYLTFRSGANHPGPQRGCCSSRSWMAASLIMTPQYNSQSEQCQVKTCSPIEECLVKKPQGNFDRTGVFIGQENRRAYIQLSGRSGTPSIPLPKSHTSFVLIRSDQPSPSKSSTALK